MGKVLAVAVGVVIRIADDDSTVCASVANGPLDDLVERLRQEMRYGRGADRRPVKAPGVTVGMAAAHQESSGRN